MKYAGPTLEEMNTPGHWQRQEFDLFSKQLSNHDWYWQYADDSRAYRAGSADEDRLRSWANDLGDDAKMLFNTKFALAFPDKKFLPFPTLPTTTANGNTNTQTQTQTNKQMKDLNKLHDITLGAALIALFGNLIPDTPETKAEKVQDEPQAEETPKRRGRPAKTEEKSAKAIEATVVDDEEGEDEGPSADDLRKVAVNAIKLNPGNKDKIKAILEKVGVGELASVPAAKRAAVLKAIEKIIAASKPAADEDDIDL